MRFQSALLLFLATGPVGITAFQPVQPFGGVSSRNGIVQSVWGTTTTTPSFSSRLYMSTTESPAPAVNVKRLKDSAVEIEIPVPGSATKAAYDKVCIELSKQLTLPGFRKGSRIPPQVLEQTMAARGGRNALKVQAINELVNSLVQPTLKAQALDPIGTPALQVTAETLAETFVPGDDLTLKVQCDVWPEITWLPPVEGETKSYTGLTGSYKRKPFNQVKLDNALRDLKERYASLELINDDNHVLALGDACTVNMVGYMANADGTKGEPLPNAASGDNVEVILGPGRYMEGLVEGILGHKKGDKVEVSVTFPEKLRDKTLAGKRALFDVEILDCSKRSVPEVTDEFAARVKPGLTAESLLAELRKAIDEDDAKEFTPARNAALGKALAERIEVEVPDTLITNQAREKFAIMMADMRDNGVADDIIKQQINPENFNKYKAIVKDDIVRDFKISMATDEIARLEGITVPDYQIEEQLESIRKDAAGSEDFDENMVRMKVETTMQRQAVMEYLAKESKLDVIYEEEKFDERLLEQLAADTLKREQELTGGATTVEAAVVDAVVEEVATTTTPEPAVVEEATPEPAVVEPEAVSAPVVEVPVVVEEPVAVAEETQPAAVAADEATTTTTEVIPIDENMSLEEKAFAALFNAGAVRINKSPEDPDYDNSQDDLEAPENRYVKKE